MIIRERYRHTRHTRHTARVRGTHEQIANGRGVPCERPDRPPDRVYDWCSLDGRTGEVVEEWDIAPDTSMHPIDSAIYEGTLTRELLREHASQPLPPEGHSYWGDARHAGHHPVAAARIAARQMGAALESLAAIKGR